MGEFWTGWTFVHLVRSYVQTMEACLAEWWTPRTLDLEVQGSSLARRVVSLDKELHSTLSLFTQVYKWLPATYLLGGGKPYDGLASRPGGSSNTPRLAPCYGNRYKLRHCGPLTRMRLYHTNAQKFERQDRGQIFSRYGRKFDRRCVNRHHIRLNICARKLTYAVWTS